MKQQIISYFRDYSINFKQNPLQGSLTLLMQLVFLLGWGAYFYFTVKHGVTTIIPGRLFDKGNIYIETIDYILEIIIFTYVFIKILPMMFANDKKLSQRFIALFVSALMDLILLSEIINVGVVLPHRSDVWEAFWCWSCVG